MPTCVWNLPMSEPNSIRSVRIIRAEGTLAYGEVID